MFRSNYFTPWYFNEYFKIRGEVTGGGGGRKVSVNLEDLKALNLEQDDEEIMEFIVAFVLSR
jgi:hypothetical protein